MFLIILAGDSFIENLSIEKFNDVDVNVVISNNFSFKKDFIKDSVKRICNKIKNYQRCLIISDNLTSFDLPNTRIPILKKYNIDQTINSILRILELSKYKLLNSYYDKGKEFFEERLNLNNQLYI